MVVQSENTGIKRGLNRGSEIIFVLVPVDVVEVGIQLEFIVLDIGACNS